MLDQIDSQGSPCGQFFHPTCPCSHGNRDTALREAPTLLRVCQSLVEAGPGSCEASRTLYECAFTVLASFIQHPQHGSALAALLVDHACTLVMRQEGPTTSDGLQPGSSQSVYRWAGSANACNVHGRGTFMWPDQRSVPCQSASCSGVLVNCCRLCSAAHALPGPAGLTMCNDCNDSRAVPWAVPCRALKCLINITSPALGATKATIDKVLAAGGHDCYASVVKRQSVSHRVNTGDQPLACAAPLSQPPAPTLLCTAWFAQLLHPLSAPQACQRACSSCGRTLCCKRRLAMCCST